MKGRRQLAAIEPMVFGPLHGLLPGDYHKAPRGKWTIAQILTHLALGTDRSSAILEERASKTDMTRRSTPGQAVLRHLLLMLGKFPPGRKSPESTRPGDHPDVDLVSAQYRMALERFGTMIETWPEERQINVFVQHPVLGDLNLKEWIRFHYVHARHHARQIRKTVSYITRGYRESGQQKTIA